MLTIIRLRRMRTGLSLRGFAKKHGFPEAKLCQVEKGRMYVPPEWRTKLARILSTSVEQICDEHGWPRWDGDI